MRRIARPRVARLFCILARTQRATTGATAAATPQSSRQVCRLSVSMAHDAVWMCVCVSLCLCCVRTHSETACACTSLVRPASAPTSSAQYKRMRRCAACTSTALKPGTIAQPSAPLDDDNAHGHQRHSHVRSSVFVCVVDCALCVSIWF